MTAFLTFGGSNSHETSPGSVPAQVYETIGIVFFGQDNKTLTSVSNPVVHVEIDGVVKTDVASLNVPMPGQPGFFMPSPLAVGQYSFTFSTHNFEAGLYDFISTGKMPNGQTVTLAGQFIISAVSKTKMFIERLRKRVFDIDTNLYLLDEPRKIFPDDLLLEYLVSSVSEINSTPPASTHFTLEDQMGFDIDDLIITGAKVKAMRSRAVLEIFNKLSYSDAQSLAIDRMPQLSQLAQQEYQEWRENINRWKMWYAIYGSGKSAAGMGTTTIPLQVSRALSMLPNMSQTFSL